MDNEKNIKLGLLGGGVLAIVICFFLNVGEFSDDQDQMTCYISYAGNIECEYLGIKMKFPLGDCNGDDYCTTIKSTPIYGGLAMGLGVIVSLMVFFEEKIGQRFSNKHAKITILILLGIAIIFSLMNPILQIDNKYSDVTLNAFPLILEILVLLAYGSSWGLILKSQRQGETLLN